MSTYDWVTTEMFDEALQELLSKETGSDLLSIPGVYEVLSEHFNNEVLEKLEEKREQERST